MLQAGAVAAVLTLSYWIAPCVPSDSACQAHDQELARWALERWVAESAGSLKLVEARSIDQARIRVLWAGPSSGQYGEMRPVRLSNGERGAELYVRPDLASLGPEIATAGGRDPLFRDAIVYLTCLHEAGHALGLPHTSNFDDIMYSFQHGGDIPEYFHRYRRRLKAREDIRSVSAVSPADRRGLLRALSRPVP